MDRGCQVKGETDQGLEAQSVILIPPSESPKTIWERGTKARAETEMEPSYLWLPCARTDLELLHLFHLRLNLFGAFLVLHLQVLEGDLPVLRGVRIILECILELPPQIFHYVLQL